MSVIDAEILAASPTWFKSAMAELGKRETGDNAGPNVARYIALAKCGALGEPWCSIFVNAMFALANIPGTASASSQSFRHDPKFVSIPKPAIGCIVVFWRDSINSGLGHVGFYRGELNGSIYTLGGNEGDMVQIEPFPKASPHFGLIGFYWPAGVPLPATLGPVIMPAGTPQHTTAPVSVT